MAKCSTCKKNGIETEALPGQRLCRPCRDDYREQYYPKKNEAVEQMAFVRGANVMRKVIEDKFTNIARGEFNGLTAAEITRQVAMPAFPVRLKEPLPNGVSPVNRPESHQEPQQPDDEETGSDGKNDLLAVRVNGQ